MNPEQSTDALELSFVNNYITTFTEKEANGNKGKLSFLYDMIAACQSEVVQSLALNHAIQTLNLDTTKAERELETAKKRKKDELKRRKNKDPHSTFNPSLPSILVRGGELPEIVEQAEKSLTKTNTVFQQGGILAKIVNHPKTSTDKGISRAEGSTIIQTIEPLWLAKELTAKANWLKYDARMEENKGIDCPPLYAKTLLAKGQWTLPVLSGIIEAPTLRYDGSILDKQGYDPETGLFFEQGPFASAEGIIPTNPSKEMAMEALGTLTDLLSQFPFEENEDFSVAISAILTALIRKSIKTAPLHIFSAPKMRTGKTLLAHIVALIATGHPAAVINQTQNEEEEKKRLLALLMAGDNVIVIDNISGALKSDALCSILTEEFWKERLLGTNMTHTVRTSSTFLATGNNLVPSGDLSSRTLLCYLNPPCERPEEREFNKNLFEFIPANRVALVTAGLIILRAFHCADRPKQNLLPYGGFEDWSNWVRSAIVWCGMPDPCRTRSRVEEGDSEREILGNILSAWIDCLFEYPTTIKDVFLKAENYQPLMDAITPVAKNKDGNFNILKLGNYLQKFVNREEGGLRLLKGERTKTGFLWSVKRFHRPTGQAITQLSLKL